MDLYKRSLQGLNRSHEALVESKASQGFILLFKDILFIFSEENLPLQRIDLFRLFNVTVFLRTYELEESIQ